MWSVTDDDWLTFDQRTWAVSTCLNKTWDRAFNIRSLYSSLMYAFLYCLLIWYIMKYIIDEVQHIDGLV